jgi:hypothetical protein
VLDRVRRARPRHGTVVAHDDDKHAGLVSVPRVLRKRQDPARASSGIRLVAGDGRRNCAGFEGRARRIAREDVDIADADVLLRRLDVDSLRHPQRTRDDRAMRENVWASQRVELAFPKSKDPDVTDPGDRAPGAGKLDGGCREALDDISRVDLERVTRHREDAVRGLTTERVEQREGVLRDDVGVLHSKQA